MRRSFARCLCRTLLVVTGFAIGTNANADDEVKFDVNDVSFLFRAAKMPEDLTKLISASEAVGGDTLWPKDVFSKMMEVAKVTQVTGSSEARTVSVKPEFETAANWKVVGIRVDPVAPGANPEVQKASRIGVMPQIRLVLQPVVNTGTKIKIHDVTAHLVFYFDNSAPKGEAVKEGSRNASFEPVVADLKALKAYLKSKGIETAGPLTIHPGLADPDFSGKLKDFLKKHCTTARLNAVAYMGLDGSEPWIFFNIVKTPAGWIPAPHLSFGTQKGQMLSFRDTPNVVPVPATKTFGTSGGVSTAPLFAAASLESAVFPTGTAAPLNQVKTKDVADIIANPNISHFFNTDCVSCHTESNRRVNLTGSPAANSGTFGFKRGAGISGPDMNLLPKAGPPGSLPTWNVRNFGWFPLPATNPQMETVSWRAANEAAESAEYINHNYLAPASK
ncbi:MAG: hypothetical protein ACKV2Q_01460 [Planctomycetaceae bacterium]